jgi:hypothetical protein
MGLPPTGVPDCSCAWGAPSILLGTCPSQCTLQVVLLEQGETEGPAAAAFYSTLGIKDPVHFKPAATAPAANPAPPQAWAVQYVVSGDEKPMGFPLHAAGGSDRDHSFATREMVRPCGHVSTQPH